MRLKSYFADTVEEALRQARNEMGAEAMLVNSKRSAPEAKHLGAYEVVCATEAELNSDCTAVNGIHNRPNAAPPIDKLSSEVSELRQQMQRLARMLARSGSEGMAGIASDPERSRAFARLSDAEVDADLAHEIVTSIRGECSDDTLRAKLVSIIRTNHQLGACGAASRMVALVGPPGAGKTTTLVKLAFQFGVAARKSAHILTLDTYRIAAAEEVRSYAAILGIGCQVVESPANLVQAIEENRQKSLILIDTPGLCRSQMDGFLEWAEILGAHNEIDTHLVLPASMRASDLIGVAGQYGICRPDKLVFTRLDETETFGPILSLSARLDLPVSFLSRGQSIPEDLDFPSPSAIAGLVLGAQPEQRSKFGVAAA